MISLDLIGNNSIIIDPGQGSAIVLSTLSAAVRSPLPAELGLLEYYRKNEKACTVTKVVYCSMTETIDN